MQSAPATKLFRRLHLLGRLGFGPRPAKPLPFVLKDQPDEALVEWTTHPADLRRIIKFRRVLDLGCGTGARAVFLARQGYVVDAVGDSAEALVQARLRARKTGVSIHFHFARPLDFLPTEPYDLVIDHGCYHLLEPGMLARYLAFLRQHTSRGSRLILRALIPRDHDPVETALLPLFEAIDRQEVREEGLDESLPFRLRSYHMYRWE